MSLPAVYLRKETHTNTHMQGHISANEQRHMSIHIYSTHPHACTPVHKQYTLKAHTVRLVPQHASICADTKKKEKKNRGNTEENPKGIIFHNQPPLETSNQRECAGHLLELGEAQCVSVCVPMFVQPFRLLLQVFLVVGLAVSGAVHSKFDNSTTKCARACPQLSLTAPPYTLSLTGKYKQHRDSDSLSAILDI